MASRFGRVWSRTLPKGDEDTENDWDEGGHKGPVGNGEGFEFDDDVDFASPFLRGILSDQQLVLQRCHGPRNPRRKRWDETEGSQTI